MHCCITIIFNSRTYSALSGGIASGVIGLNGMKGLLFYFAIFAIVSLCLHFKCKFLPAQYFKTKSEVLANGITDDLLVNLTLYQIYRFISNFISTYDSLK